MNASDVASEPATVRDDFEASSLDPRLWSPRSIAAERFWFDTRLSRDGRRLKAQLPNM